MSEPTREIQEFFEKRTREHNERVRENIVVLAAHCRKREDLPSLDLQDLFERAASHDYSKWSSVEFFPYIWKTWDHKCRGEGKPYTGPNIDKEWDIAVRHHYTYNDHHPEFYDDYRTMPTEAVVEMVADWCAVSREKGTSLSGWYEASKKRWSFSDEQHTLIEKLVAVLEKEYENT